MRLSPGGREDTGRIGFLPIQLRRDESLPQSQEAEDGLDASGSAGRMAGEGLGGRNRRQGIPENAPQRRTLRSVIVGRPGAMRIDITDVLRAQPGHRQSLLHGKESAFAIFGGSRLMKGVAGIAEATQNAQGPGPTALHRSLGLQDQEGSALPQVQAGPRGIERAAWGLIQDHQGAEPVQVEIRQAFAAAHRHDVGPAAADQIRAENNGIGRRGASRGERRRERRPAEMVGDGIRGSAAVVQPGIGRKDPFRQVHAADGRPADERNTRKVFQSSLLQGFLQGDNAQERSPGKPFRSTAPGSKFLIRSLDFPNREAPLTRLQILHGSDAGHPFPERVQGLFLAAPDGADDTGAGDMKDRIHLFGPVRSDIVRHDGDALEDLLAFLRAGQPDAVVALQQYDQFQDVDGVESQSLVPEQRGVIVDILRRHPVQVQGVDEFQFDFIDQGFHICSLY